MKRKGKFLKLRSKVGPMHWPPLSLSLLDAVLVLGLDTVRSSFTWLLAIHMCFITVANIQMRTLKAEEGKGSM